MTTMIMPAAPAPTPAGPASPGSQPTVAGDEYAKVAERIAGGGDDRPTRSDAAPAAADRAAADAAVADAAATDATDTAPLDTVPLDSAGLDPAGPDDAEAESVTGDRDEESDAAALAALLVAVSPAATATVEASDTSGPLGAITPSAAEALRSDALPGALSSDVALPDALSSDVPLADALLPDALAPGTPGAVETAGIRSEPLGLGDPASTVQSALPAPDASPETTSPEPAPAPAPDTATSVEQTGGDGTESLAAPTGAAVGPDGAVTAAPTDPTAPAPTTQVVDAARTAPATPASAAAAGTEVAGTATFDRTEAWEQLATVVRPLRQAPDGTQRLTLALRPAELGTVHLEVGVHDGRFSVHAVADNPASRDLLAQSLPELRAALTSSGIDLGTLDVSTGTSGGDAGTGASSNGTSRDSGTRPGASPLSSVGTSRADTGRPGTVDAQPTARPPAGSLDLSL